MENVGPPNRLDVTILVLFNEEPKKVKIEDYCNYRLRIVFLLLSFVVRVYNVALFLRLLYYFTLKSNIKKSFTYL